MDGRDTLHDSKITDGQKEWQSGHHENRQDNREDLKQERQPYPPPGSRVAKNSQRPVSVETVQGGVSSYGVQETLVVNGKKYNAGVYHRYEYDTCII